MYIRVRVRAGARKEIVLKVNDDTYAMSVKEPAKQNLANKRVTELLIKLFNREKGSVRLISGHHSPTKVFTID